MKYFFLLSFLFFLQPCFSQTSSPEPAAASDEKYFLPQSWMQKKGLELNTHVTTPVMKRWTSLNYPGGDFPILFDIRLVFKNEKDAIAYMSKHLEEMSEGALSTPYNLKSYGANESKVFTNEDKTTYNFIFRVKKVVAKVFVSVATGVTYDKAVAFAKQAVTVIKTAK